MKENNQSKKGFIAIVTVLLISVVALSIAVSVTFLGLDEAQNSLDFKKGLEAFKLAEACGEEALLRLRNDDTYTGSVLTFDNGSCTSTVTDLGGDKQIDSVGTITGPPVFTRNLRITIGQDGNGVSIVTWEELN